MLATVYNCHCQIYETPITCILSCNTKINVLLNWIEFNEKESFIKSIRLLFDPYETASLSKVYVWALNCFYFGVISSFKLFYIICSFNLCYFGEVNINNTCNIIGCLKGIVWSRGINVCHEDLFFGTCPVISLLRSGFWN